MAAAGSVWVDRGCRKAFSAWQTDPGGGSVGPGRQSAVAGRRLAAGSAVAAAALVAFGTAAARRGVPLGRRLLRRLGLELLRLSRLLALAASAGMRLVRSVRWRPFGR